MANEKPPNPPAFPVPRLFYEKGMTLRDCFAKDCPMTFEVFLMGISPEQKRVWNTNEALLAFALARFQYADAMLTARMGA